MWPRLHEQQLLTLQHSHHIQAIQFRNKNGRSIKNIGSRHCKQHEKNEKAKGEESTSSRKIVQDHLNNFKLHDKEIYNNQHALLSTVASLSKVIGMAYTSFTRCPRSILQC